MVKTYNSNDIAERIKALAKEKNIPVNTILSESGLAKNTLTNFKTSIPKADNLAKIADYLGVSVDYLLGRTDNPSCSCSSNNSGDINRNNDSQHIGTGAGESLTKRDSELLQKVNSLSLDDYADIISYINSKIKAG